MCVCVCVCIGVFFGELKGALLDCNQKGFFCRVHGTISGITHKIFNPAAVAINK